MKNIFNYYKLDKHYLFSMLDYKDFKKIDEEEISNFNGPIYYLTNRSPLNSRRSFSISSPAQFFWNEENLNILELDDSHSNYQYPNWLLNKISKSKVTSINTAYPKWEKVLKNKRKRNGD